MLDTLAVSHSLAAYLAIALLVCFAAFMQGLGGVGFAMFVAPIAVMFAPEMVPGTLLTLGGLLSLLTAIRERGDISWPAAGAALGGRVIGAVMAIVAFTKLGPGQIGVTFAVMILAAVALSIKGPKILPSKINVTLAGIASGLMGTLTSVGAPPLAIAFQHSPAPNLRATIGIILFAGSIISLTLLSYADRFSLKQLLFGVALTPFVFAGFAASGRFRKHVSQRILRTFLLGFCSLSAMILLLRSI